jgi:hypothetical protein
LGWFRCIRHARKLDDCAAIEEIFFHSHSTGGLSFTRLFAVTRSALWKRIDLLALLKSYGAASGRFKVIGALDQAWLSGFRPTRA